VDEVTKAGGLAHAVPADVDDPAAAAVLFDAAQERFGPVDALVNNAGITGRIGAFADLDVEIMRRVLDINVLGTMLCAQEAVRRWRDSGTAGNIVNISSSAATLGSPHEYVNYAASKAAVDAFTVGLAKELASTGTRVNAVAPGITDTEIHAAGGEPNRVQRVAPRVPMGRVGKPEETANAVAWLLSAESSYVTGAIIRVAGGI